MKREERHRRCHRFHLRTVIAVRFAVIVLAVIFLISAAANSLINSQFEKYVGEQQAEQAKELAQNVSYQYDEAAGGWNLDYIHGLGMYALDEGYIIKLYDAEKNVLWDAENHDMTLCYQMMHTITVRMQEKRPDLEGEFVIRRFELKQGTSIVGYLDVSYYGPYSMSESDFQFLAVLNRILGAVSIVSLLGAVAMGLLLANSITKPVGKAAQVAQQISQGQYTARFTEESGTKELYELTQAVNQMAASLEAQEALRKRLTSDVAHELRTPLANVSSYLEAILDGVWEPTPDRLQNCYDELQRLSSLVSELEKLRQVEDGNLRLQKVPVDLLEAARAVACSFETQLMEKGLQCQVDGASVVVRADDSRIRQVITNLVSNAIKYSNENGMVKIWIGETEEEGILRVEDDGIGIAEAEQGRIFERFYRTDQSRDRRTGGAGIGLTIVKSIVEAHGGRITVGSAVGRGSRFEVTLPKSR